VIAFLLALALQLQLPAPVGLVNDFARVLDPAAAQSVATAVEEVRAKSGGEIVVVTLTDLAGRPAIDVARDIGRMWRVGARGDSAGDRRRNAGVVVLLKPGKRPGDGQAEFAIATGTGAEGFITDAFAGRVRDAVGREAVAQGSYGAGLAVGVRMLAEAYAREYGFTLTGASPPRSEPAPRRSPSGLGTLLVLVVLMALVLGGRSGGGRGGWGRRRGGGLDAFLIGSILGQLGGRGGGFGGGFGGGGFGGFGGGGGFMGGGASGRF
jgi:uncharacterized protein